MAIEVLSKDTFQKTASSEGVTIIDFWAEWCGPCRAIAPALENLSNKYEGNINVAKINVSENKAIAMAHGVSTIPCLVVFRNGKEIDRSIGFKGEAALEELFIKHS